MDPWLDEEEVTTTLNNVCIVKFYLPQLKAFLDFR